MDANAMGAVNELVQRLKGRSLPIVMRGYDREATDRLLADLEQGLEATLRSQASALSRLGELERRISEGQEREEAVTEALVVATQIKSDSERQGQEIKETHRREGEAMVEDARQRAEEIRREAEAQAETIVEDARSKAQGFERDIRETEQLAVEARGRLRGFLESLLAELEPHGEPLDSAVDDLLARAGHHEAEPLEVPELPRVFADPDPWARSDDGSQHDDRPL
jgi:cell division septum initiation protein DivIVA